MVTSTQHPTIQLCEINGQLREVRQTPTARVYSRPKLLTERNWSLVERQEHDSRDDLRDLDERFVTNGFVSGN